MRLIKNKNISCEPFYRSINSKEITDLSKYQECIRNLYNAKNLIECRTLLKDSLNALIRIKEVVHFKMEEHKKDLTAEWECSQGVMQFFRRGLSEEKISLDQETDLPQKIYDSVSGNEIIVYVQNGSVSKNILIISFNSGISCNPDVLKKIHSVLLSYLSQYANIKLQQKVNTLLSDINVYDSKFNNQYKYSAIGEMTSGVVEEILNPLQIILSYVDLLENENNSNSGISSRIRLQVQKVEGMVQRLVKFAGSGTENIQRMPVNINSCIQELHYLIKSTLLINKIETVLDLGENIPSIISNKIYVNQMLTNVFTIIKNSESKDEGLLLQTRFNNNNVIIRIIYTAHLYKEAALNEISFIEKMMNKHGGKSLFTFESEGGSVIELFFPITRKAV